MFRDDIKDRVIELMHERFSWLNDDEDDIEDGISARIHCEYETFEDLVLDRDMIREFADEVLPLNFELEHIDFARVMEWQRVKDIVDYLEDNLEKPYISGFEPEA